MKKPNLCILLDAATFVIKNTESTLLAPGMYFRVMLIGFFEGIESERGIAWRVARSGGAEALRSNAQQRSGSVCRPYQLRRHDV